VGCERCRVLGRENQELTGKVAALERENKELRDERAELLRQLDKSQRAGKRQAAPFSKGEPKKKPKRPGRKAGDKYGRKGHRQPPERVDEVIDVPVPDTCPHCKGTVTDDKVMPQYQVDLPPIEALVRQFDIHVGHCDDCGRRVQNRHPLQTSDALGAAASQLGPRLLAQLTVLKLVMGLSYPKVASIFSSLFGIDVTTGGLAQALQRVGKVAAPTYEALKATVASSAVVSPDETGWRVRGRSAWLWAFATNLVTVYMIEPGRGYLQAVKVLGEDFSGTLVRDGWAPYRRFKNARHQTCLAHLLRRCSEMLGTARRGAARLPHGIRRILKDALVLRDRRDAGTISTPRLKAATEKLRARLSWYLTWRPGIDENRKLVKHLNNESDAIFTFLEDPAVPATNHMAERAIRPSVVTRKTCGGGNREWAGATATATLLTILRTALQQGRDPQLILADLLRHPGPAVADCLLQISRSPPDDVPPTTST